MTAKMGLSKLEREYLGTHRNGRGCREKQREGESTMQETRSSIWDILRSIVVLLVAAFVCSVFVWLSLNSGKHHSRLRKIYGYETNPFNRPWTDTPLAAVSTPTEECSQRKEWRALTRAEQKDYISAVLCLNDLYSNTSSDPRLSANDDFPWTYSHVGYTTHSTAAFLPWHRYFLHAYEETLRNRCGYRGSLPYWDWTLDSEALERSPVFDPVTGFGGDGEVVEEPVDRMGRCVSDGPFAGTNVSFYDTQFKPHCLSRGFRDSDGNRGHVDGTALSPSSIEEVFSASNDFEAFSELMQTKVHDTIPFGIGGDFATFTAPYDPLFFLHHAQLDRLWWIWQQRQPQKGIQAYGGRRHRFSVSKASLDDWLHYKNLAPKVQVKDVMDIESKTLCYRY